MATPATGLAKILSDIASQTWSFINQAGQNNVTGTWSRSNNKSTWQGDNPVMQNTSGSSVNVDHLVVHYGEWTSVPAIYEVIAIIPHTTVPLDDGDSVEYTSIEIEHETDDVP